MKLFGELIRTMREDRGLPLRKVAAFIDLDPSLLSKIERGERNASKKQVVKIAEYFDLDENYLLCEYYSDCVAYTIYNLSPDQVSNVFSVTEQKIKYIKSKNSKQGNIDF